MAVRIVRARPPRNSAAAVHRHDGSTHDRGSHNFTTDDNAPADRTTDRTTNRSAGAG